MTAIRPASTAAGGSEGKGQGEDAKIARFRLLPPDRSPDELEQEVLSLWKEEKLFDAETMPQINLLRRALAGKKSIEAMELLLKGLTDTRDNREFLDRLKQNG